MPLILPMKELRNTNEISNLAHKVKEPIFITKNGYSDLVVMSSELHDRFARINRIDQAILIVFMNTLYETGLLQKLCEDRRND